MEIGNDTPVFGLALWLLLLILVLLTFLGFCGFSFYYVKHTKGPLILTQQAFIRLEKELARVKATQSDREISLSRIQQESNEISSEIVKLKMLDRKKMRRLECEANAAEDDCKILSELVSSGRISNVFIRLVKTGDERNIKGEDDENIVSEQWLPLPSAELIRKSRFGGVDCKVSLALHRRDPLSLRKEDSSNSNSKSFFLNSFSHLIFHYEISSVSNFQGNQSFSLTAKSIIPEGDEKINMNEGGETSEIEDKRRKAIEEEKTTKVKVLIYIYNSFDFGKNDVNFISQWTKIGEGFMALSEKKDEFSIDIPNEFFVSRTTVVEEIRNMLEVSASQKIEEVNRNLKMNIHEFQEKMEFANNFLIELTEELQAIKSCCQGGPSDTNRLRGLVCTYSLTQSENDLQAKLLYNRSFSFGEFSVFFQKITRKSTPADLFASVEGKLIFGFPQKFLDNSLVSLEVECRNFQVESLRVKVHEMERISGKFSKSIEGKKLAFLLQTIDFNLITVFSKSPRISIVLEFLDEKKKKKIEKISFNFPISLSSFFEKHLKIPCFEDDDLKSLKFGHPLTVCFPSDFDLNEFLMTLGGCFKRITENIFLARISSHGCMPTDFDIFLRFVKEEELKENSQFIKGRMEICSLPHDDKLIYSFRSSVLPLYSFIEASVLVN